MRMNGDLWGIKALIAIYMFCWLIHQLPESPQFKWIIDIVGIVLVLAVMFAFVVAYHIR